MSKNQNENFIKNLDLQKAEEEFEQMMKQMEEDKKNHDFSIPKEWDDDFRAVMDEVLVNKAKKKGINVRSKFAMAAGIALVLMVGTVVTTEAVQGDKLLNVFMKISETENERYEMYGTDEDFISEVEEEDILSFTESDIGEVYEAIRNEKKRPIFQLDAIPIDYEIKVAEYDKFFNVINIQLQTEDGWVYIAQKECLQTGGFGRQTDLSKCSEIENTNIEQVIEIYGGQNEEFYSFAIQVDKDILYVQAMSSLELCENLARTFVYR